MMAPGERSDKTDRFTCGRLRAAPRAEATLLLWDASHRAEPRLIGIHLMGPLNTTTGDSGSKATVSVTVSRASGGIRNT